MKFGEIGISIPPVLNRLSVIESESAILSIRLFRSCLTLAVTKNKIKLYQVAAKRKQDTDSDFQSTKRQKQYIRKYNVTYLEYGFVPHATDESRPFCLVCIVVLTNEAMKPSRLKAHLLKKHPDKANWTISQFQKMKENFEKRRTLPMLAQKANYDIENGLIASYKVSKLIAKCSKAHTIGEQLIIPAVTEILSTVFKVDTSKLRSVPLSNNTMSRRIDEMSDDIEANLCLKLQETEFSIQLDESTVRDDQALLIRLVAYVWFINNKEICEEMLFCHSLETFCQGENIF